MRGFPLDLLEAFQETTEVGEQPAEFGTNRVKRALDALTGGQRHLGQLGYALAAVAPAIARALRAERARGRGGHWTYDLNRHIALAQAYTAERRHLKRDAAARRSNHGSM